jgi:hypothetical protein
MNPRTRLEADAQVVWADAYGQAGLTFRELTPRAARQLKDWLLVNLLALANEAFVADEVATRNATSASKALMVGGIPLPSIRVERSERVGPSAVEVSVPWWPYQVSFRSLAVFTDALAVLCAVLLFTVVFIVTSKEVPSWPLLALLAGGTSAFFAAVYRYWFWKCPGGTPGMQLAHLASDTSEPSAA